MCVVCAPDIRTYVHTLEVEVKDVVQLWGGIQLQFVANLPNNLWGHPAAATVAEVGGGGRGA